MKGIPLQRFNSILLAGVLVVVVLVYARDFLIPVTFAIFFAMLMTPVSNKFEKWGMGRVGSTILSVLIVLLSVLALMFLISVEAKNMADDFPVMEQRVQEMMDQFTGYISKEYDIPVEKQKAVIKEQLRSMMQSSGNFISSFLGGITGMLTAWVLIVVCMFLFLLHREKYETFLIRVFDDESKTKMHDVIARIGRVAQHYLAGRMLSVLIFTLLFTIGFLIVGVKNAFLLSLIAALMTIIPYVGSIIGGLFPFAVALVSGDSLNVAFGTLIVNIIVQAFDNYFIEPYIIGGEVNISAISTILGLFVGGLVWGTAGMIMFIPMLGVLKIIFDNVEGLQPYGYLIGDQSKERSSARVIGWIRKMFIRK